MISTDTTIRAIVDTTAITTDTESYQIKDVNLSLAKPPLNFNGGLVKLG